MGCANSKGDEAARLPNEETLMRNANAVRSQAMKDQKAIKLLLLGSGSSGKTTFRKQLRNIYVGFSEVQRTESAPIILENLWLGAKTLANALQRAGVTSVPQTKDILLHPDSDISLTEHTAKMLHEFWKAKEVQDFVKSRPPTLQVQECTFRFFEECANFPEWGGSKWIPSVDDCIRARVRSSGVAEEHCEIEGTIFKLFDAGGQRSERRKWIHYFDSVNSVLFMTSLTAYCENLFEDATQNSLVESLDLFDNISNSKWFRSTPMMLFFNKKDLFEECLVKLKIPLNRSGLFPDAPDTFDVEQGIQWQIKRFKERRKADPDATDEEGDTNLYCHVTTAVSKDNVDKVFATCRTIILKDSLKRSGFVPT